MKNGRHITGVRKSLLSVAVAALTGLFAGCAEDVNDAQQQQVSADGATAITFGAQTRRGTTRAGVAGDITTDNLKTGTHKDAGFGVFAYYNDNGHYNGTDQPNFMYNQQVTYDSEQTRWTYSPLMYWPNEHGAGAESAGLDCLSFFAYAPWVRVAPATGLVTDSGDTGIVGMTRHSDTGAPALRYVTSWTPASGVDLLWGTGDNGLPLMDLTKPAVNDQVTFTMRHATAKLNVQVDADVDDISYSHATDVDGNTRIWVRSVTLTGMAPQGELCLNNDVAQQPRWSAFGGGELAVAPVSFYDGRLDGFEALSPATDERQRGLNPVVVQSARYGSSALTAGVTSTAVNLFDSSTPTAAVYVIPNGAPMDITISYDVETRVPNSTHLLSDNETPGVSVSNTITKNAVVRNLEAGKTYSIVLHLGMNSVKLDTEVAEWEDLDPVDIGAPIYSYEISRDRGNTWGTPTDVKPDWLTIRAAGDPMEYTWTSTNSTSTATAVVASDVWQRNVAGDALLKDATPVSNVDLSMQNNNGFPRGTRTTANCYLVHAPGTYRIPLVYGNAIKDGATNTLAYLSNTATNTYKLQNLVNHNNDPITDPWLKNNGATPNGADLVWEDVQGLMKNVGIDGDYLTFEIGAENIAEGNAVVAATKDGVVVWSWHIWVTPETLSSLTNIDTGAHTNLSGALAPYRVAPVNVGQVNGRFDNGTVYAGEWCRVTARSNGETTVFIAKAKDYFKPTTTYYYPSPYYQWGRKDAMVPCIPAYDKNGAVIPAYSVTSKTDNTPGYTIQHPEEYCYDSSSAGPYGNGTYKGKYNYWDMNNTGTGNVTHATVKTVYDPCPPGFCVPTSNLYYYMGNGGYRYVSDWDGTRKVKTWTLNGASLSFPALGDRNRTDGVLQGLGLYGIYWSASPIPGPNVRILGFRSNYWRLNEGERSFGDPMRAVLEE